MENDLIMIVVILGAAVLVGAFTYGFVTRSRQLVQKWAAENGYELLSAQYSMFFKGPYFWSSRSQAVYRVQVRDREGRLRSGWVRCGGWFAGMLSDRVEGVLEGE